MSQPNIRRAVAWLKATQNADGGWGESAQSYDDPHLKGIGESTASQTAWALMGLMSAGETRSAQVTRGIAYLLSTQQPAGTWDETSYTGTGFPKVFYLRYHYYCHYFPLMALGMFARLKHRQFAPVPREERKSRALKQFYKQPKLWGKVARLRALSQLDSL